ncbi:hypothetical protein L6452_10139 [Arctium lappa]|uniref:Uncharacterized protein n=1 Tax=Arctium lappa TaxID=4217 RepID=A0ACB9DM66_ARCLA|nr:hypothetical protein L6452_10139 [Arctium lappa]
MQCCQLGLGSQREPLILVLVPLQVLMLECTVAMHVVYDVDYVNDGDDGHAYVCDDDLCACDGVRDGDGVCAYVRVLGSEKMLVHLMVGSNPQIETHLHHLCLVPSSLE